MSQSKKGLLKTIRRDLKTTDQRLWNGVCLDILILDTYIELCQDIEAIVKRLQCVPSGHLESVPTPVTYHDVDQLHLRLAAFQKSIDPARHLL